MNDTLFKQITLPSGRKKYVPCSVMVDDLPTGIYFVDIRKNVKETASCTYLSQLYKVGEPKQIDLTEICGMHQLAARVMETEEFRKLLSKSHSIAEIVEKTIAIINSFKKEK